MKVGDEENQGNTERGLTECQTVAILLFYFLLDHHPWDIWSFGARLAYHSLSPLFLITCYVFVASTQIYPGKENLVSVAAGETSTATKKTINKIVALISFSWQTGLLVKVTSCHIIPSTFACDKRILPSSRITISWKWPLSYVSLVNKLWYTHQTLMLHSQQQDALENSNFLLNSRSCCYTFERNTGGTKSSMTTEGDFSLGPSLSCHNACHDSWWWLWSHDPFLSFVSLAIVC